MAVNVALPQGSNNGSSRYETVNVFTATKVLFPDSVFINITVNKSLNDINYICPIIVGSATSLNVIEMNSSPAENNIQNPEIPVFLFTSKSDVNNTFTFRQDATSSFLGYRISIPISERTANSFSIKIQLYPRQSATYYSGVIAIK